MSIPYNTGIPNPPADPSVDAPNMQTNTNSLNSWVQVDHIGFNTSGQTSGFHKQVSFQSNNVPVSQPAGSTSVLYTNAGTADSAHPQLFWENSNSWSGGGPSLTAPFHLSAIRAWAYVNTGVVVANQAWNCTVAPSGSDLVVTFKANAVSSDKYGVLLQTGSITSQTSSGFTIHFGAATAYLVFIVLQI